MYSYKVKTKSKIVNNNGTLDLFDIKIWNTHYIINLYGK